VVEEPLQLRGLIARTVIGGLLVSASACGGSATEPTGSLVTGRINGLFPAMGATLALGDRITLSYTTEGTASGSYVRQLALVRDDGASIDVACGPHLGSGGGVGTIVEGTLAAFVTGHMVVRAMLRLIQTPTFTEGTPCAAVSGPIAHESSLVLNWRGPS
jgi:hypothetical protein